MENPWKGKSCVVTHKDGTKETFSTDLFEFNTKEGETVLLTVSESSNYN